MTPFPCETLMNGMGAYAGARDRQVRMCCKVCEECAHVDGGVTRDKRSTPTGRAADRLTMMRVGWWTVCCSTRGKQRTLSVSGRKHSGDNQSIGAKVLKLQNARTYRSQHRIV